MCMFDDMLKVWSLAPSLEMRRDGGLNARESGFYDGQRLSHAGLHKHVLTLNIPVRRLFILLVILTRFVYSRMVIPIWFLVLSANAVHG